MDTDPRNNMEILDADQCWALLSGAGLGRLAVSVAGYPDIFPVNYVVSDEKIVFRTAEGSKLASVAVNEAVAFEIDGFEADENRVWSVVAQGHSHIISNDDEAARLEALPLVPWNLAEKVHFVQIEVGHLSGRRFLAEGRPGA
jgi:nitroimidazol reductase NimA-like FMN-containing flavoprotein (pyridoxamine 5'-phosphate oxidase superfamily)